MPVDSAPFPAATERDPSGRPRPAPAADSAGLLHYAVGANSSNPDFGRKRGDMTIRNAFDPPPDNATNGVYDKCLLHEPASIRAHLQRLIDGRCMLTATGDVGAAGTTLTAPLAIEDDQLWVDVPRSASVLDSLLRCKRLSFEGAIDKITLRFSSGPPRLGSHDGCPALLVPMPQRLLHLQRRELMRREPPPGALDCLVPARDPARGLPPTVATIRDIGGGGLAVLVADATLALAPGDLLPDCVIELPGLGAVEVTLHVRHVSQVRQRGRDVRHAGCEFIDLPAATEAKLFRYLMHLDREQLARRREIGAR